MSLQIKSFKGIYILSSFLPLTKDELFYLHCVDSRLEENGRWFSRFHIGPFFIGSRLQVGTRIRRSLLNDLMQTSIIAVKLDGAKHEFSRLSGTHESVLDLLFQFRKITINAPFIRISEITIVPFIFYGPGIFYAKDIPWPSKLNVGNPMIYLVSLSPGSILRGRILVKKNLNSNLNSKNLFRFGKTLPFDNNNNRKKISPTFPWIRLGYPSRLMKRVGFRIESLEPVSRKNEILILEIVTNGSLSPRIALREASLRLTHKFSLISSLILPFLQKTRYYSKNNKHLPISYSDKKFNEKFKKVLRLKSLNPISFFNSYPSIPKPFPFTLDLGNLDLSKERYIELQNFGLKTIDQLLERLSFDSHCFSPILKKQRQESLFYIGFFSF